MDKVTFERHVAVAEKMRMDKNYLLDISKFNATDVALITVLCQNDSIFNFFNAVKDIDVRKLKVVVEFLDAQEKMTKITEQLSELN